MSFKLLSEHEELIGLFRTLNCPTDITFTSITNIFYSLLQVCIETRDLTAGRRVYCQIVRHGLESASYVGSQLIRMFAACRQLQEANCVFDQLPDPNLFTWNDIILAQTGLGCAEQALKLYGRMHWSNVRPDAHIHVAILRACASTQMLTHGKLIHCNVVEVHSPSLFVWGALIDMYSKCGSMQDARSIFDKLAIRNVVIWSVMIAGYVKCSCGEEALHLYQKMLLEGFDPDIVTLLSTLKACSDTGALLEGKLIHAQIVECGFPMDATLGNPLLNMYARCTSHAEACMVFRALRNRDVVTWSSMVDSYVEHRDHALALGFFEQMLKEGVKPDEVALLCLLSACSQLGLVENGCHHFNTLAGMFGIFPRLDHINCMVDLFGRTGCLVEAEDLLKTMPYQENLVGWRCLLSHSKSYGDVGNQCHIDATALECEETIPHSICSNHTNAGFEIATRNVEGTKQPCTLDVLCETAIIMVHNSAHSFTLADEDQFQNAVLWEKLFRLFSQMKEWGYSPCLDFLRMEKESRPLHFAMSQSCSKCDQNFQEA